MTESGIKLLLWLTMGGLAGALLWVPQPVAPWEMPGLELARDSVRDTLQRDAALASQQVPRELEQLEAALLRKGRGELVSIDRREATARDRDAAKLAQRILDRHGTTIIDAARARAVQAYEAIADSHLRPAETDVYTTDEAISDDLLRVGGFVSMLERYGVYQNGKRVAPVLTRRALYKARWNATFGLELVEGLSEVERQAYWGWLALHATNASWQTRSDALVSFARANGRGVKEAGAMMVAAAGRTQLTARALRKLDEERHRIRLRNLALGAMVISKSSASPSRVDTPSRIP